MKALTKKSRFSIYSVTMRACVPDFYYAGSFRSCLTQGICTEDEPAKRDPCGNDSISLCDANFIVE